VDTSPEHPDWTESGLKQDAANPGAENGTAGGESGSGGTESADEAGRWDDIGGSDEDSIRAVVDSGSGEPLANGAALATAQTKRQ
jgi:hypothetical protein